MTDDLVAHALRARRHPEFLAERAEGFVEGREAGLAEGRRDALRAILVGRFGAIDAETELRIRRATASQLERWVRRAATAPTLADVVAELG